VQLTHELDSLSRFWVEMDSGLLIASFRWLKPTATFGKSRRDFLFIAVGFSQRKDVA